MQYKSFEDESRDDSLAITYPTDLSESCGSHSCRAKILDGRAQTVNSGLSL